MFQLVEIRAFSTTEIVLSGIAVFFLILTYFFSGTEIAFFSISDDALNKMALSEKLQEKRVFKLLSSPKKALITIQIIDVFLKFGFIISAFVSIQAIFNFEYIPFWTGIIVQVAIVLFLALLFAESIPKVVASQNPQKIAERNSGVVFFFQTMLKPLVNLLANSTSMVDETISKTFNKSISPDELSVALEKASTSQDDEKDILEGIIKFSNIKVSDIMTSRMDMVDADIKSNYKQILDIIIQSGYSRIPVYADSTDNIKGVLFGKDLLPHLDKPASFRWQSLIRPPYYVPETKRIDNLLNEFQENHVHLAIVVDEYGGTSGLVTMEDIMEEIVGEINDEYDDEEVLYTKTDDYNYNFVAKILLNDFFKITDIDEEEFSKVTNDVETLAGMILEIKGEIPMKGEKISYKKYDFTIIAVNKRRIQKVKFHIKTDEEQKDEK